jgi:hypothetical protein
MEEEKVSERPAEKEEWEKTNGEAEEDEKNVRRK